MATKSLIAVKGWHGNSKWTQYSNIQIGPGWQTADRIGRLEFEATGAMALVSAINFDFYKEDTGSGGTFKAYVTTRADVLGSNYLTESGVTYVGEGSFGSGKELKKITFDEPSGMNGGFTTAWYLLIKSTVSLTISATTVNKKAEIKFTYENYTNCKPPTTLTLSRTNVEPNGAATLSWSGAEGGTGNTIKRYDVYRSTTAGGSYAYIGNTTTTSLAVTAPTANGSSYYYKVITIGNVAGYDSGYSIASSAYTCSFSAPSVSGVTLDNSTGSIYVIAGTNVTLRWTGSNGTNNAIKSYNIYQNGAAYKTGQGGSSLAVPSHSTAGSSYYYAVLPIGTHSNGASVNSPSVYSYVACGMPTAVSVNGNNVPPSTNYTLSWSGATAGGQYNAITSYEIHRSTSPTSGYTYVGNSTGTSYTVASHASNGSAYYYKVLTVGTRLASGLSTAYGTLVTHWTKPTVSNVTLGGSNATQYKPAAGGIRLAWSAADGTNNAVSSYTVQYSDNDGAWANYKTAIGTKYYDVTAPGTGNKRRFRVIAIAPHGNSTEANSPYLYAYSAVKAPTTVTASPTTRYVNEPVTISWSGAGVGVGVGILKYELYCNDSLVGSTTGSSLSVNVPGTAGNAVYKVKSKGTVSGYDSGLSEASATVTVKTVPIPPANPSLVTPNKWSMAPLEVVRNTLTVYDNAYTHKITYSFHGSTSNYTLAAGVKTHDFTFPEGWLASRTTSSTGSLAVSVGTYNGATLVGTKAITITINIPSSYGPTIGSFTAVLVKNGGPASIDRYIKGISKVTLSINSIGTKQGATVTSKSITGGGYSSANTSATFGALMTAGVITFTATVTDSRGFSKTATVQITVQAYASPALSGVSMFRCDVSGVADKAGTYVSLKGAGVISSIDGQNTPLLQGRVYMRGGTPGAFTTMTNNTVKILGGGLLLTTKTYIAEIKISDKIGDYSMTVIIPTDGGVGFHILDGGTGAAIGKYAETTKRLEIPTDWNTNFNSGMLVDTPYQKRCYLTYTDDIGYYRIASFEGGNIGGAFIVTVHNHYNSHSTRTKTLLISLAYRGAHIVNLTGAWVGVPPITKIRVTYSGDIFYVDIYYSVTTGNGLYGSITPLSAPLGYSSFEMFNFVKTTAALDLAHEIDI